MTQSSIKVEAHVFDELNHFFLTLKPKRVKDDLVELAVRTIPDSDARGIGTRFQGECSTFTLDNTEVAQQIRVNEAVGPPPTVFNVKSYPS